MNESTRLTMREAYAAMYAYLQDIYDRTKSDELGALLGGLSFLQDRSTADPAAWTDWEEAVHRSLSGTVDVSLRIRGTEDG